jgi:HAD superfamily hydrolase (TIGR01549 family)
MIRAFLFDIGNVLIRFDFARAIGAITPLCDLSDEPGTLARFETVKVQYEDGRLSRADFLREAAAILRYRGTQAQFIAAWQGIFWKNEPMFPLVRHLHGRHPLFLLSNTNDMHVEAMFRDFDIFHLFSGATYSHAVQASKPHRAIYEIACRQHGLDPGTTFFIDDLAANIATARELGFCAHHYHHEKHDELLAAIRSAGIDA